MTAGADKRLAALSLTEEDRSALLRKYRLLAAWRQSKDATAGGDLLGASGQGPGNEEEAATSVTADRAALRALSREFPGALRELDVLGLPEISRRIRRLGEIVPPQPHAFAQQDAQDAQDDRWMGWVMTYHRLMRAALMLKRAAGRDRTISATAETTALVAVRQACGFEVGASFVSDVLRPPGGRLGVVVLTALAREFQTPATEISRVLFPPRRPAPYRLPS